MRCQNPRPIPLDDLGIQRDARRLRVRLAQIFQRKLAERTAKTGWNSPDAPFGELPWNFPLLVMPILARVRTGRRRVVGTEVAVRVFEAPNGVKSPMVMGGSAGICRGRTRVIVDLNGAYPLSQLAAAADGPYAGIETQLVDLLRHEMTHVGDWGLERGANYQATHHGGVEEKAAYFNDPLEVRAFLREVVDEVRRYVRLTDVRGERPTNLLVDRALAASVAWQTASPHLRPENERRILGAAYQAVMEERAEMLAEQRSSRG